MLYGSVNLQICGSCRDTALTFLRLNGVPMTTDNPFIAELCLDSHAVESAWFEYYDRVTQGKGIIIRGRDHKPGIKSRGKESA